MLTHQLTLEQGSSGPHTGMEIAEGDFCVKHRSVANLYLKWGRCAVPICYLNNQCRRPEEGIVWLKKSYEIQSRDIPFNPRESAFAADNAASGFATLNNFKEADAW
ncbi:hypothetical protein VTG60DRAFT_3571 [Thermothelomyces hinnuleus]